jgi:hypothetical protein
LIEDKPTLTFDTGSFRTRWRGQTAGEQLALVRSSFDNICAIVVDKWPLEKMTFAIKKRGQASSAASAKQISY